MQLGCWTKLEDIPTVAAAGFAFAETPVATLQPEASDAVAAPIIAALRSAPIPVRAFNLFIPPELKIVGPSVDSARLHRYAEVALERIDAVGAKVLVFGSGPARNIPDGFPRAAGIDQFIAFSRFAGDVARRLGIVIGIESITRKGGSTNILNTFAETAEIARVIDHPAVKAMADVGQMDPENEAWEHLSHYGKWIVHVHLTDSDRRAPGTGHLDWLKAFGELHKAGYDGLMSLECRWEDFATQAPTSARFVEDMWARSKR
jgi:sugar phosphate isomerase/epimerase